MTKLTREQSDQLVESMHEMTDAQLLAMGMTALEIFSKRQHLAWPQREMVAKALALIQDDLKRRAGEE